MKRALTVAAVAAAALLLADTASAQCAMCRTALESPEAMALAAGFRGAVLFLLAVPFRVVGVIAALIFHRSRTAPQD